MPWCRHGGQCLWRRLHPYRGLFDSFFQHGGIDAARHTFAIRQFFETHRELLSLAVGGLDVKRKPVRLEPGDAALDAPERGQIDHHDLAVIGPRLRAQQDTDW